MHCGHFAFSPILVDLDPAKNVHKNTFWIFITECGQTLGLNVLKIFLTHLNLKKYSESIFLDIFCRIQVNQDGGNSKIAAHIITIMITIWAAILLFPPSWFTWIPQKKCPEKYFLNINYRIWTNFRFKCVENSFKDYFSYYYAILNLYQSATIFLFPPSWLSWIATKMFVKIIFNYLAYKMAIY